MQDFINLYGQVILIITSGILVGVIFQNIMSLIIKKVEGEVDLNISYKKALNGFFFWATVLLAIYFCSFFLNLQSNNLLYFFEFLKIGVIILITFYFIRGGKVFILRHQKDTEGVFPLASLLLNLFKIISFLIGSLLILNVLGISITPMLTALGIGGLAVALALQDTLSNLFAGLYIIITKNINIGDFIKFEDNEGQITDITLRTTTIHTLQGNLVVVPNSKISSSTLTNYYLPDKEIVVLVNIGVSYDSDLEFVEKITIEVAKETMINNEGGVKTFEPIIRYNAFADSSINFVVVMKATDFLFVSPLRHEFIKKIHARYKDEQIEIPFPIRNVFLKQI
jgi:small-conductance mechanosensitive channel